jgi:hypothetical protein
MPSLSLFVRAEKLTLNGDGGDEVEFPQGVLPLHPPLIAPDLTRLLYRRMSATLRCPPIPGAFDVILDTGAPFALFPRRLWRDQMNWQEGRHFETCRIAGLGPLMGGRLLDRSFRVRLVRLTVPVELAGRSGDRLRIERPIAQLAEPNTVADDPKFAILGLFGGVFEGRRLAVERSPLDDLTARMEW